ncbi:MAG: ATP-binding protein [Acidobacteriota bacterium]|nr:ATP-binding protein [Acidobacteriota bacterium]
MASPDVSHLDVLAALQRSDERYRAFLQNSTEAIWRFELDEPIDTALPVDAQVAAAFRHGWLAECNDAMARMYGHASAADIVGARLGDMLFESDPANIAYIRAFIESGYRLEGMESHERDRDGHDKYFVNNLVGMVEDGQLLRAWGTQRDVTGRKAADAEREAHDAEMRDALAQLNDLQRRLTDLTGASGELLATLEGSSLAAAIVRVARTLVDVDAAAVWLLRDGRWSVSAQQGLSDVYDHEAIGSTSPVEFNEPLQIPDVSAAGMHDARRSTYAREGIQAFLVVPLRIRDSNTGTLVLYSRQPRVFSDVEVRVAAALGSVAASAIHIADLYALRDAATQRATFLASAGALLSSSLDVKRTLSQVASLAVPHIADWCAVHLVRDDGVIEQLVAAHVNPEKVEWAERLRQEYPTSQDGRSGASQVIRTGEAQLFPVITEAMIEASATSEEHLRMLRALAVRSAILVPMTARGRTSGAITLISTAESGRQFDEDDMSLAQELASRAAMATDNARLYQEAQEASRLKDDFFATLSHELRTPVNAVLGWSQLLADGMLDEEGNARAVQAILRNARAQARLLNDILEMSRIVAGKVELQLEAVDVAQLAAELIESLRPTFDVRRQIVSHTAAGDSVVHADRARLQQVLFNLLSNAAKFTPQAGTIDIALRQDGDAVELSVSDTGVGITPAFLPHVFERFRQADSSATRQHGGLGIGLAVARHIIELHGGSITAASEGPGKGATFVARLPRKEA